MSCQAEIDTRRAMYDAYKASGYKWCSTRDAFVYPNGYFIHTRDAMTDWLRGTTNIGKVDDGWT